MITISVKTSTENNVLIGENILTDCGKYISEVKKPCKAAIISDDMVYSLYGETVKNSLKAYGYEVCSYAFENGEKSKNLAGAFHQPILVVCDTKTFDTLDPKQISCGMAEVIKYGIICDRELFDILETKAPDYTELSARCIGIKRDIVERDEFEHGDRKLLNLGHTLGHAVEKHSNFELTHGAAVAVGMMMICSIAEQKGYAKENMTERLKNVLVKYGLPTSYSISADELFDIATGDKKVSGGNITAVIPESIGKCLLEKMSLEDFRELINLAF